MTGFLIMLIELCVSPDCSLKVRGQGVHEIFFRERLELAEPQRRTALDRARIELLLAHQGQELGVGRPPVPQSDGEISRHPVEQTVAGIELVDATLAEGQNDQKHAQAIELLVRECLHRLIRAQSSIPVVAGRH